MPNRNNLKYFKWAYESIRKNQGEHTVWILSASDACTDGTLEHYEQLAAIDPHFKYLVNRGPDRLGHTILYDKIIYELCETNLAMIYHCDMYLCPGALDAIERLMYRSEITHSEIVDGQKSEGWQVLKNRKRVASLTRIEPPLHPVGREKIVMDFGSEPDNFDEIGLNTQLQIFEKLNTWKQIVSAGQWIGVPLKGTTAGVFAPWAFWVDEFKAIGGHDWRNFSPQSREDDDVWNRLLLNGVEFLQTREGFVYHLTCRGNRRNVLDGAADIKTDNPEWVTQNMRSMRNFIRKWGYFVRHDEWHHPVLAHKYDVGCVIKNCTYNLMANLEPWFSEIQVDLPIEQLNHYIESEQVNTKFDLRGRLSTGSESSHDIICYIDGNRFTGDDFVNIQQLSDIVGGESPDDGCEFELGNLRLKVNKKRTLEQELIICENEPIEL